MGNQLRELAAAGQSVWLDNIKRSMFASGELQALLDDGLRGMTSNPTIFEKAIGSGTDYDAQINELEGTYRSGRGCSRRSRSGYPQRVRRLQTGLRRRRRARRLRLARGLADARARHAGTIDAAARLWKAVDRPNVMIKIPGTPEGCPAVRATIAAGINVNVTLLFSVDRYADAADAYIEGLEDRAKAGLPIAGIASVASVFVSRIDTAIDKTLDERIARRAPSATLSGNAGIANLKLTYQRFEQLFHGERFAALKAKGATVQRPLWASTSTKNPAYDDLMYVVTVVGPRHRQHDAAEHARRAARSRQRQAGHGPRRRPGRQGDDRAAGAKGISLHDVTEQLVAEGVKSFAASFNDMLAAIAGKQRELAGTPVKVEAL